MINVLTGSAISAGLVPAVLGVEFATVAAGHYPIGIEDKGVKDNRTDMLALSPECFYFKKPFKIATHEITNEIYAVGLQQLDRRTTLLFRTSPVGEVKLVARGTKEAIETMTLADLRKAVEESITLPELRHSPDVAQWFQQHDPVDEVVYNGPLTLVDWRDSLAMDAEIANFAGDRQPVVFTARADALVWSAAFGWGLPTERMWEAAAGGLEGRKYATPTDSLYYYSESLRKEKKAAHFGEKSTADVGSYPGILISGVEVFDLTGNVWEWTGDGQMRRGGAWNSPKALLQIFARNGAYPGEPSNDTGFRVVQNVPV